ncbi:MAG: EAL domain-containing protein [Pseudomonadota bacterium]|nr:EAL domain-containing protein [Pseudomonadota bacterium]
MIRTPVHLLLVEDDAVDRLACKRALAEHPEHEFRITEAETARAGIAQARLEAPDLILLDHRLPDMNGLEFLAELAAETGEIAVPVVMLTGTQDIAVAVDAMRRGARDYLTKDSERNYLQLLPAVIRRVLREQRSLAEKREAEAKYRCLVEQIPTITYTADLDLPGHLLYISPQIRRLGFTPEEWLASPDGTLARIHPDDRPQVLAAFARSVESNAPLRCEYRLLARNGEARWFLDEAMVLSDERGRRLFLQGVLIDITEDKRREAELEYHRRRLEELVSRRTAQLEKQTELLESANTNLIAEIAERRRAAAALRESETRFRLLLESAGEGIYGLDNEGRCTFVNDAALEMLGYTRQEIIGRDTHSLIHHSYADGTPHPVEACRIYDAFRKGDPNRGIVELFWRKDNSCFPTECSVQPLRHAGRVTGAVLVFRDVSEAQALTRRLSHQASHDALTGLVNRQEFERRLDRVLADAQSEAGEHALCYLDLDQFKVINDSCGHAAGDHLLREIAGRLQGRLRARDTLARLGGDEFGVLLERCPLDQALRIATELRDEAQSYRFTWEGKPFKVGVSIGLVPLTAADSSANALIAADAACYAAKELGRNRVHVFHLEDAVLAHQRAQAGWVSRLTHALDADRFRLYSQPIAPLSARKSERPHYEILLRLLDEDDQLIEPGAFIPAAERYNLMPTIDRWVIREVISRHAAREALNADRPLYAINLSGHSLVDERLVEFVRSLLDEYHVPADMLCFEISETTAIANLARAACVIEEFKQLGCLFALDNFGSGIASFGYLRTLPVDYIKIDGGFIRTLAEDRIHRAMAEAINRIAHVMAIETVAECAESVDIIDLLREMGVDHAQGYALAIPQPLEQRE